MSQRSRLTFMKKYAYYLITIAAAAGLGWWAFTLERGRPAAIEIAAPASANPGPSAPASGADRAGGAAATRAPGPARGGTQAPRGPVGVEAARAERVSLSETVSTVGTLRANESVVVKPEIAGRIDRIGFEGGSLVRKGALLVVLDATVAAAEAEQIRAELALARSHYQRTADLARQQFVSESARDQAASNLKVVEAKLKLAEAKLAKTGIRAPFSGRLGLRNFSVGDFIREGTELVVLEDVSQMKVDLRLPERFLGQLRQGQSLALEFDAYPGRRFEALLEAIDVQVDANGRSVVARGRMANPDGLLRTGMFARVSLTLAQRANAVVVPEEAVVPVGEQQYVYRIDEGKAVRQRVRTGLRRDGKVEIVEGLRGGEQVVTAGQPKLTSDATEVRIVEPVRLGG
ncbi:MAG: efflux RND transporter periplasmic adaptor subunit [Burkholderiales bacterium]|nr:efflux RND transporter periplasmic adaptor subunit [Burkholderiales bacterium]